MTPMPWPDFLLVAIPLTLIAASLAWAQRRL